MDQVTENLFVTKAVELLDLADDNEFEEIISLCYRDHLGLEQPEPTTTENKFVFPDGPHDYDIFEAAVDYTIESLERGNKTLVHCQAGVSRSPGVCIAAITVRENIDVEEARSRVKEARPVTNPTSEVWGSTVQYIVENTT